MELEGLDQKQISTYQTVITENNINGKVLATCDLNELGHIMGMTFGDWQLFRAWILAARNPAQECTAWYVNTFACDFSLCIRFFKMNTLHGLRGRKVYQRNSEDIASRN